MSPEEYLEKVETVLGIANLPNVPKSIIKATYGWCSPEEWATTAVDKYTMESWKVGTSPEEWECINQHLPTPWKFVGYVTVGHWVDYKDAAYAFNIGITAAQSVQMIEREFVIDHLRACPEEVAKKLAKIVHLRIVDRSIDELVNKARNMSIGKLDIAIEAILYLHQLSHIVMWDNVCLDYMDALQHQDISLPEWLLSTDLKNLAEDINNPTSNIMIDYDGVRIPEWLVKQSEIDDSNWNELGKLSVATKNAINLLVQTKMYPKLEVEQSTLVTNYKVACSELEKLKIGKLLTYCLKSCVAPGITYAYYNNVEPTYLVPVDNKIHFFPRMMWRTDERGKAYWMLYSEHLLDPIMETFSDDDVFSATLYICNASAVKKYCVSKIVRMVREHRKSREIFNLLYNN